VAFAPFPSPRLSLLIFLVEALSGCWAVEQPHLSMLRFHPRVMQVFHHFRVTGFNNGYIFLGTPGEYLWYHICFGWTLPRTVDQIKIAPPLGKSAPIHGVE